MGVHFFLSRVGSDVHFCRIKNEILMFGFFFHVFVTFEIQFCQSNFLEIVDNLSKNGDICQKTAKLSQNMDWFKIRCSLFFSRVRSDVHLCRISSEIQKFFFSWGSHSKVVRFLNVHEKISLQKRQKLGSQSLCKLQMYSEIS